MDPYKAPARSAIVDFDRSYLITPLNYRLRIWGKGVGGYEKANGAVSRHSLEASAQRAAAIWIETGIFPTFQTPERIAAARVAVPHGTLEIGGVGA